MVAAEKEQLETPMIQSGENSEQEDDAKPVLTSSLEEVLSRFPPPVPTAERKRAEQRVKKQEAVIRQQRQKSQQLQRTATPHSVFGIGTVEAAGDSRSRSREKGEAEKQKKKSRVRGRRRRPGRQAFSGGGIFLDDSSQKKEWPPENIATTFGIMGLVVFLSSVFSI